MVCDFLPIIGEAQKLVTCVAGDEKGSVPLLERNGKALEEMFYFYGIILSPSTCQV